MPYDVVEGYEPIAWEAKLTEDGRVYVATLWGNRNPLGPPWRPPDLTCECGCDCPALVADGAGGRAGS